MSVPTMPRVLARGRWWSADELDAIARRWRAAVREALGERAGSSRPPLPATPEGVALFVALDVAPLALDPAGARTPAAWRTEPGAAGGHAGRADAVHGATSRPEAERLGLAPVVPEPAAAARRGRRRRSPCSSRPASSSSRRARPGLPKPVFQPDDGSVAGRPRAASARSGSRRAAGILIGVSLASAQGRQPSSSPRCSSAAPLGSPRSARSPGRARGARPCRSFSAGAPRRTSPTCSGRCALTGPAVAPPVCLLSSPIARAVFDAFLDRFGVPLRQTYSSHARRG